MRHAFPFAAFHIATIHSTSAATHVTSAAPSSGRNASGRNDSEAPATAAKPAISTARIPNAVIGGDTFRYLKPLQPNQIIDVKLEDVATGNENNNNYKFTHANGNVKKPTRVKKF